MPADPEVGDAYRQEYYPGEAEDMAEILAVGGTGDRGSASYDDVVVTEDWTPLEPEVVEEKSYAPGVGLILERTIAGGRGHARARSSSHPAALSASQVRFRPASGITGLRSTTGDPCNDARRS